MNVLFFVRNEILPTTGGVERVTSIILDALKASGKRVHVIHTGIKEVTDPARYEEVLFTFLPDIVDLDSDRNREFILSYIKKNKIDVAINKNANLSIAKHLAANRGGNFKIVSCLHTPLLTPKLLFEYHLISSYQPGLIRWIKSQVKLINREKLERKLFSNYCNELRFVIKSSDATIVPSRHHIDEYKSILPLASCVNIFAINNPVSFPKQDIKQLLKSKRNTILAVSRLERASKRVDLLLRAWGRIHKKHPDWKLVIVGGPRSNHSDDAQFRELVYLKGLARKLKIENVVFTGHQNPIHYYEESSIFAMTSASEAWGMSLVEAQQFGCAPVVFESFSALQEIMSSDENGLCVPFGDIVGFAQAISLLIEDPSLREKIACCAEESTHRFRQEKIGKDWIDLLEVINVYSDRAPDHHRIF